MRKAAPLFLLVALLFAADRACYYGYTYVYSHQKNNEVAFKRDALKNKSYELFIMGSSRANHHYDTRILDTLLKTRSFNLGDEGKKLSYQLPLCDIVFSNPAVHTVILDVLPDELSLNTPMADNQSLLMLVHDHPNVKGYFSEEGINTSILLSAKSYYYNSQTFPLFTNYLMGNRATTSKQMKSYAGFLPLKAAFSDKLYPDTSTTVNPVTALQFKRIIEVSKKNKKKLCVVISPFLNSYSKITEDRIRAMCNAANVPFISYADSAAFKTKALYVDSRHLNESGAALFTASLVGYLQQH